MLSQPFGLPDRQERGKLFFPYTHYNSGLTPFYLYFCKNFGVGSATLRVMYTLYISTWYISMYYVLVTALHITYYILHHSRHSPALHDIVPTLDQAMQSRSQAPDTVQQTSWTPEPRVIMALPIPTPGGKVKYWCWLYFWLMG